MEPVPFDMALARDGYLSKPDGCPGRYVYGLDHISDEATHAGVTFVWGDPIVSPVACYCTRTRRVILSPWLYWVWPCALREVILHELAHRFVGTSQEMARAWQNRALTIKNA